jgi:hypothetical protein
MESCVGCSSGIGDNNEPSALSEDAAKPCGSVPPQELALPKRLGALSSAHVISLPSRTVSTVYFVGLGGSSRRMNERPRFSSAVRSVLCQTSPHRYKRFQKANLFRSCTG